MQRIDLLFFAHPLSACMHHLGNCTFGYSVFWENKNPNQQKKSPTKLNKQKNPIPPPNRNKPISPFKGAMYE